MTNAYAGGSAPGVHFADVRVLGSNGAGYTSDVIAGIDWTIANAQPLQHPRHQSLARAPGRPSRRRPIRCAAPSRARSQAGLVVVVSAGNYGRTATGAPILGGITSPGNSPFAITVGALDTQRHASIAATIAWRHTARADRRSTTSRSSPTSSRRARALVSLENPQSWLSATLSRVARRRQRPQRVLPSERHEHVGGRRQRRRGAAARLRSGADAGAGQGGAADGRALHAPRRADRRAAPAAWTFRRRSGSRTAASSARC